jgi:hypothetical protein
MSGTELTQYIACPFYLGPDLELKIANKQLWVSIGIVTHAGCTEQYKFKGATLKVLKLTCRPHEAPLDEEIYVLDVQALLDPSKCDKEWHAMLRLYKTLQSTLKTLASTYECLNACFLCKRVCCLCSLTA